jgi:phosphoribosylformylglycinamidine synthase
VRLAFDADSPCVWTRGLQTMEVPTRHGEGKFLTESVELLERLEANDQIVARYVAPDGRPTTDWPHNPNGSPGGVAGICDPSGRLFGLMPHPDAYLYPFHHPRWRRQRRDGMLPDEGEGMKIFRNGVDAAAASL